MYSLSDKDSKGAPVFSLSAVAQEFDPEKYSAILRILGQQYITTNYLDPTKILEGYLSIVLTGKFSNISGSFDVSLQQHVNEGNEVKDINELLNSCEDAVDAAAIIWNALMLKKRILIIGSKSSISSKKMLRILRSICSLISRRKSYSLLHPLVKDRLVYIDNLQKSGFFIASTFDDLLPVKYPDLFDVLIRVDGALKNAEQGRDKVTSCKVALTAQKSADMPQCPTFEDIKSEIKIALSTSEGDIAKLFNESAEKVFISLSHEQLDSITSQAWMPEFVTVEGFTVG